MALDTIWLFVNRDDNDKNICQTHKCEPLKPDWINTIDFAKSLIASPLLT